MEPLIFLSLPSSFSSPDFYAKFRAISSPLSQLSYWLSRYSFIRAHSCFLKAPLNFKTSRFLLTSQVWSLIAVRHSPHFSYTFFFCVSSLCFVLVACCCGFCPVLWYLAWPRRRLPGTAGEACLRPLDEASPSPEAQVLSLCGPTFHLPSPGGDGVGSLFSRPV